MSSRKQSPESWIVNIYGIELQVYGYYEAPEDETNSPQGVEITDVNHAEECIKDLLSDDMLSDVQTEILQNYY